MVVLKRSEKKKTSEKWAKTTKNPENGGQNGHLDNKRSGGGGSGPGSRAANRAAGRLGRGAGRLGWEAGRPCGVGPNFTFFEAVSTFLGEKKSESLREKF